MRQNLLFDCDQVDRNAQEIHEFKVFDYWSVYFWQMLPRKFLFFTLMQIETFGTEKQLAWFLFWPAALIRDSLVLLCVTVMFAMCMTLNQYKNKHRDNILNSWKTLSKQ